MKKMHQMIGHEKEKIYIKIKKVRDNKQFFFKKNHS